MTTKTVTIINEQGLHARPAHILAKEAMKFTSKLQAIKNENEDRIFNPKSILSIMGMAAAKGDKVTLIADGIDEEKAIEILASLIETGFDE